MFSRRITLELLVGFLVVMPHGCARGPYTPLARKDGQEPHQLRHGITMLDKDVRDSLLFINRTAKRTPNGQVQVRIQMRNLYRDETLWSDIRFSFYDADKMAVDQTEWQRVAFPPHEVVMIKDTSLRNDVNTYNIQFRDLESRSGRRLTPPGRILEHGLWRDSIIPE